MREQLESQVAGMSCAGCETRVGRALSRLDGVVEAAADHRDGQVQVMTAPARCGPQAVIERIETAGYRVTGPCGR